MKISSFIVGLTLLSLCLFSSKLFARCIPKDNQTLIIGHSYNINWWIRTRMKSSARVMRYKIKFYDLRQAPSIEEGLKKVHGVLVPGGADINPDLYFRDTLPLDIQEKIKKFRHLYVASGEGDVRDPFEHQLIQTYYQDEQFSQLPLLGICRGMQMMSVVKGIPLVLDLKAELGIKNRDKVWDRFFVSDPNSLISEMFPRGVARGYKVHHQNPRMDYLSTSPDHPEVKITATSFRNRVIEAIELTDRPAMGIQFHPEKSLPKVKHRFFGWLLKGACEKTHL